MKGKDECTHFGNIDSPPDDAECKECQDIDKYLGKVFKTLFPYEKRQIS